jgi:hypothetical protein
VLHATTTHDTAWPTHQPRSRIFPNPSCAGRAPAPFTAAHHRESHSPQRPDSCPPRAHWPRSTTPTAHGFWRPTALSLPVGHACATARPCPHWPSPHGITAATHTSRVRSKPCPDPRPPHLARSCVVGPMRWCRCTD